MRKLFLLLGVLFAWGNAALAQSSGPLPPTQCVTTSFASGTGDAIQLSNLPCTDTTTLLILTFSASNTTVAPTISINGRTPHPIVNFDGTALGIGELASGQRRQLTFNGTNWYLLSGGGGACPTATSSSLGCVEPDNTTITINGSGVISAVGGGGGACGTPNGVDGQVCNSLGGASSEWGQRVIGKPGTNPGDDGFAVTVTGGASNGAGAGGAVNITGGLADATSGTFGGAITITGGAGGGDADAGGAVTISGGASPNGTFGNGGDVIVNGGVGDADGGEGGSINITAGSAVTGLSGDVSIIGGANDNAIHGGAVNITGGSGNSGNFVSGGDVTVSSGNGIGSGNILITTPVVTGGAAGTISLITSDSDVGSAPNITITNGKGGGNTDGGIITIESKGSAGSGIGGRVIIRADSSNTVGSGVMQLSSGFSPGTNDGGGVNVSGHIVTLPGTDTSLSISSCGSLPQVSASSNDHGGTITVGSGTVTSCTITFAHPWTGLIVGNPNPYCVANSAGGTTPVAISISAISTSAVTFSAASDLNGSSVGGKINYMCGY